MIIDEYKVIFIHIPKNAGTSIETYFANRSVKIQPNKHALDIVYDRYKKDFKEYGYKRITKI